MSDGYVRRISKCWGKEVFTHPGIAMKIARRDRAKKGNMEVYRCQKCSGWHLGTLRHVRKKRPLTAGNLKRTNSVES